MLMRIKQERIKLGYLAGLYFLVYSGGLGSVGWRQSWSYSEIPRLKCTSWHGVRRSKPYLRPIIIQFDDPRLLARPKCCFCRLLSALDGFNMIPGGLRGDFSETNSSQWFESDDMWIFHVSIRLTVELRNLNWLDIGDRVQRRVLLVWNKRSENFEIDYKVRWNRAGRKLLWLEKVAVGWLWCSR